MKKLTISLIGATIGSIGLYLTALNYTVAGAIGIGIGGILIAIGAK